MKAVGALEGAPSEVHAPPASVGGTSHVHFLPHVLPHVADPQVAVGRVEVEPPRVAQAVRPDLSAGAFHPDERIVVGDGVRAAVARRARVDAQDLAEQFAGVQRPAVRVVRRPAVAERDVQQPVRPERQVTGVVPLVRLGHGEDGPHAGRLEHTVVAHGVLGQDGRAIRRGVVHVGVGQRGMEGQAQQALLVAAADRCPEVQHGGADLAVRHRNHDAGLGGDVQAGVAGAPGEIGGLFDAAGHDVQPYAVLGEAVGQAVRVVRRARRCQQPGGDEEGSAAAPAPHEPLPRRTRPSCTTLTARWPSRV